MFYKAALDINEKNGLPNRRFISCVRFVADEATPAVFYLNSEWSKREFLSRMGVDPKRIPEELKPILEKHDLKLGDEKSLDMPALVYLKEGAWEQTPDPETGTMTGLRVPKTRVRAFNFRISSPSPS